MRSALPMLLMAASLAGAAGPPTADTLLAGVRKCVVDSVRRLPNYMCTQTIDRVQYEPRRELKSRTCAAAQDLSRRGRHLTTSDRLRLNVAIAGSREIYSWVGEDRFDDRNLVELVGYGPLSTGSYTSFLSAIFATDIASFSRRGSVSVRDRKLVEYQFSVSKENSQYLVRGEGGKWFTSAYAGTFLVDPVSFDLVRLVIRAVHLPPETKACEDTTTLEFGRASLNNFDFLLPTSATFGILHPEGIETENHIIFTECHEFRSESKLSFESTDPSASRAPKAQTQMNAPLDLPEQSFRAVTTAPIDVRKAAVGDSVPGQLTMAISGAGDDSILPAGTPVKFRIMRLQRYQSPSELIVGLHLESVSINSQSRRINARPTLPELHFSRPKSNFVIRSGIETCWTVIASSRSGEL